MSVKSLNKYEVPDLEKINGDFKRSRTILDILFALLTISSISVFVYYLTRYQKDIRLAALLSVIVALFYYIKDSWRVLIMKKEKIENLRNHIIGNFKANEIEEIVAEILKYKSRDEVPTIYLIESKESPFVIDVSLFNFIKPLNAVYIPKYLLSILNRDELKSIIAHEIAHFYAYNFQIARFPLVIYLAAAISPVFLISKMELPAFLFTYYIAFKILIIILNRLFYADNKNLEYLSDLFAAKVTSKKDTINAFLVMGRYEEVSETLSFELLKAFKKDKMLSFDDFETCYKKIYEKIDKELRADKNQIIGMIEETLNSPELKKLRKKLSEKKTDEKEELIDLLTEYNTQKQTELLDWSRFDFIEENYKIDNGEYDAYIENIKGNNGKVLFDSIIDEDNPKYNPTHPSLRKRILSIDKNTDKYELYPI